MAKTIITLYNISQFLGWTIILAKVVLSAAQGNLHVLQDSFVSQTLGVVQGLQFLDLVFAILGLSSTKLVPSLIQVGGRNAVVWWAFPYAVNTPYPLLTIVCWAIADIIRFLTYLNDSLSLGLDWIKILRYNAFILLYPLGITGEFLSAGAAKSNLLNQKTTPDLHILGTTLPVKIVDYLTFWRLVAYPGLVFMFYHMVKLRSRFYKNLKAKNAQTTKAQ